MFHAASCIVCRCAAYRGCVGTLAYSPGALSCMELRDRLFLSALCTWRTARVSCVCLAARVCVCERECLCERGLDPRHWNLCMWRACCVMHGVNAPFCTGCVVTTRNMDTRECGVYVVESPLCCCCCMLHCMHTQLLRAPAMHASCTALAPISCCLYHQGGTTHAVCRALLHGQQAGLAHCRSCAVGSPTAVLPCEASHKLVPQV